MTKISVRIGFFGQRLERKVWNAVCASTILVSAMHTHDLPSSRIRRIGRWFGRGTLPIDAKRVSEIFNHLGETLRQPTFLCLIGSAPGLATGQMNRQTPDIDVWHAGSIYDATDLANACLKTGILFDPRGELDFEDIYIQIVRPGIVNLPSEFDKEVIGRYGNLTVGMPTPELLAASKLVRGTEVDIEDVVWWVRQRGFDLTDIEQAVARLPRAADRNAATENLVVVEVVAGGEGP